MTFLSFMFYLLSSILVLVELFNKLKIITEVKRKTKKCCNKICLCSYSKYDSCFGDEPTGSIYYKTNIKNDYQLLPRRTATNSDIRQPNLLHSQRLKISKKKWQHLLDLKSLLPADCHYFYDNIPFE